MGSSWTNCRRNPQQLTGLVPHSQGWLLWKHLAINDPHGRGTIYSQKTALQGKGGKFLTNKLISVLAKWLEVDFQGFANRTLGLPKVGGTQLLMAQAPLATVAAMQGRERSTSHVSLGWLPCSGRREETQGRPTGMS